MQSDLISIFWLLAATGSNVYASIPCAIPPPLAQHTSLQSQWADLSARADVLNPRADAFNTRCNVSNPQGSPEEVACAQQEAQIKNELANQHAAVKAYNQLLLSSLDNQVSNVAKRKAGVAAQLDNASKNSAAYLAAAQDWADKSEHDRIVAQAAAISDSIELAADAVAMKAGPSLELNKNAIGEAERWYASYGQMLPESQRATMLANIERFSSYKDSAENLSHLSLAMGNAIKTVAALGENEKMEALTESGVTLLKLLVPESAVTAEFKAGLSIGDVLVTDAGYGWLAVYIDKSRANQFYDVEDINLKAVNALVSAYVHVTNTQNDLKAARAALVGSACFAQ